MKRTIFVSALLLAITVLGCSDDEYECEDFTTVCGTARACCTSDDCYYEWNGETYECDGTDCSAAADRLARDMCGKSADSDPMESMRQDALRMIDDILARYHL